MVMLDIEALGDYFVKNRIMVSEEKTFGEFIDEVQQGREVDLDDEGTGKEYVDEEVG